MQAAESVSKWADSRYGEGAGTFLLWLLLYLSMLTLGVLGDIMYCKIRPLPLIWAQVLPELHYIGVIFAATCFGAAFGFTAACAAGVLHATASMMTCDRPGWQIGHFVMFAGVALITGAISKHRSAASFSSREVRRDRQEPSRTASLSELGRMMPEVVEHFLTPIASIEGAGYVLAESDLSDNKRQELLEIIRKECRSLELLVGLLDLTQSRFSTYQETNVSKLLDGIVERCRTNVNSRITVRNATSADLPRLRCDSELINYALQTLTANAIRAISEDGEIELSATTTAGEMVITIEARAECSGSPLGTPLSREFRGIDLAVVRQIINRHHGSLHVDPGSEGVTISIFLPLKSG